MPLLRYISPLFCLVFFAMPFSGKAMHIIGGDMTYRLLDADTINNINRYQFTLKVYRDGTGGGATFDDPAPIAVYRGTYQNNALVQAFSTPLDQWQDLIPDTPSCVAQIPFVDVEEAIYEFTLDLPISNQSYFIVYQRCCRNVTISNIATPGDVGATYMIEVTPEAQVLKNSSPVFNNFPPIIICNGFPLEFDHSATDQDGDLLVYSFCSPLVGGGPILAPISALQSCFGAAPTPPCAPPYNTVTFLPPGYSPGAPMGGNPTIAINSNSGFISGTPNMLGQFVVGVCVEEYRNGVLLSTVRRDFQFNVADCSPTVIANVAADSIAGPQEYVVRSCGSNTVDLINLSVQQQFIDKFKWDFDLGGSLFADSTNWNASITFPDTGSYMGTLLLNPGQECGDTAQITVNIYPAINASFSYDYDTCVAGPVVFTDESTGEAGVNRWSWDFGVPGGTSNDQSPTYLYPIPGDHPVTLRAFDTNNCFDDTTQVINWFPVPPLIIIEPSDFIGCAPANIFFNNLSSPIDSTYDIFWDFGDGNTTTGVISPSHLYTDIGVFDVKVEITSPIGCYTEDSFNSLIRVEPSPTANFTFSPDTLLSNFNNIVDFTDLSIGANRWNWQFGQSGSSSVPNPTYEFPDTGRVAVQLIVTHPSGCQDSLTKYLDITPEYTWFMPNAFTPNGDGDNDEFFGTGVLFGITDFTMSIWNRWGEMVFQTTDPTQGWNGEDQNSGTMSPDGVYVYMVTFTGPRGKPQKYQGFATLIR